MFKKKKYIVGARNDKNDSYTVVVQSNSRLIASFFLFITKPFVNEIEIVDAKDVLVTKKRSPIADDEYTHLHGEDNESCKGTGMTRAFWSPPVKENVIVFGTAGSGKVHHPWDDLKPCSCGCKERPLLISMSRKEFLLNKMHEAQSFDLSKEEISIYFERISLYIEAHGYSAFRHMQEEHPIEPLSERQEICSQNAINCLFKKDFVQALHETLDILSDYNKETRLNYNEYVVLRNILITYECLKTT